MIKSFINNNRGQMLVFEVITFALLLIISVFFVYQLSPPSYSSKMEVSDELVILGYDVLKSIDELPSSNGIGFLANCISDGNDEELFWLLDHSLPSFVSYQIFVSDGNTTLQWPFDSSSSNTRSGLVSHATYVISLPGEKKLPGFSEIDKVYSYNVILEMWR